MAPAATTWADTTIPAETADQEAYPPGATLPPEPPSTGPLPVTGNSGTDRLLGYGAAALVAGGFLFTVGVRRRAHSHAGERRD